MASADFRVRFVGRFVFACKDDSSHPTALCAIAMNMGFNADLHSDPHRTLITVQRSNVFTKVSSFASLAVFSPTPDFDENAELFSWDASDCDVSFHGTAAGNYAFDRWDELVADITDLAKDRIDGSLVTGVLPERSPVAARFVIPPGLVRAGQFEPKKEVRFQPLQEAGPQQGVPARPLADVVEVDLTLADPVSPLTIGIVAHRTGAERSIVVPPPPVSGTGPVVVTVTNLCAARVTSNLDDREFASYYDLMLRPQPPRTRPVPFTDVAPTQGSRADCTGTARGVY